MNSDRRNNGSGGLKQRAGVSQQLSGWTKELTFSYTKFHDSNRQSLYNKVQPGVDQLYLGWTEPGNGPGIPLKIAESAEYRIGALYTSNRGRAIRLLCG